MRNILVIDGQGGGVGRALIGQLREKLPTAQIHAVGTNALATAAMLRAGASTGATGENAVIVACRRAKIIVGPLGIAIANSMMGEFTPAMAAAVAESEAERVLIPVNRCGTHVVGATGLSLGQGVEQAALLVAQLLESTAD